MSVYSIPPLLVSSGILLLGLFVYSRSKSYATHKRFLLVCLAHFVWLFSDAVLFSAQSDRLAMLASRSVFTGVSFIGPTYLDFVVHYLRIEKPHWKRVTGFLYLTAGLFIVIIWGSEFIIADVQRFFWGYYPIAGILHPLFLGWFLSIGIACFWLLLASPKVSVTNGVRGGNRSPQLIRIALVIDWIACVDFLPNYGIAVYPMGYAFCAILVAASAYAIVRHRAFDIRVVITQTGLLLAIYLVVLGIPFLIGWAGQTLLEEELGRYWWLVPLGLCTILATIGPVGEILRMNQQIKAASDRLLVQERLAAAGQLAAGMAHEIKNPLSAIKTFAQYLPEKYEDREFRQKFFRIVQEEIDRISDIVAQLSDFAKPAPLQLQSVSVGEVLEDTLILLSNRCLNQGIEIRKMFQQNGLCVKADRRQLKQLFLNICINSMEAMDQGGLLTVQIRRRTAEAEISIIDNGTGFSEEESERIWDPFYTTKERGMGLGLAIVRGIVDRHGGAITITSVKSQGTTVTISIPCS